MKLDRPFIRLPIRFDAEALAREIDALPSTAWRAHPQGYAGNSAVPLVAAFGDPDDDAAKGPMRPTPWLNQLPSVRQVLAALDSPIGRSRLMRIHGNGEAHAHVDTHYYWQSRHRVHVPVRTTPHVRFEVGQHAVNMAAGECWVFDTWTRHNVLNPESTERIHLVIDTVGGPRLHEWIDAGESPSDFLPATMTVAPRDGTEIGSRLRFESENQPIVMTPFELRFWLQRCRDELASTDAASSLETLARSLDRQWTALFAEFGVRPAGHAAFAGVLSRVDETLGTFPSSWRLGNGCAVAEFLRQVIVRVAVTGEVAPASAPVQTTVRTTAPAPTRPIFDRPIFIVCPPRSGSSLLFETLCRSPDLVSIGGESHQIMEQIPALNPARVNFDSNRVEADLATPMTVAELTHGFFSQLRDRDGRPVRADARALRFLEKTPKNALRVAFLARAYPDAQFVVLYRSPRDTISSMLDAWRSKRFVTYPRLPGWSGPPWSLLLTPGWRDWQLLPEHQIVARQWSACVGHLLDDLEGLDPSRVLGIRYDDLLSAPQTTIERLCRQLDAGWDTELAELPPSRHTLTPADPEKWRHNESLLADCLPGLAPMAERFDQWFAQLEATARPAPELSPGPSVRQLVEPVPVASVPIAPDHPKQAFGSVYTRSFAQVLSACGVSLAVSTYQSGRVVLLRPEGEGINTHFKGFPSPMGLAAQGDRLAVATARGIWECHNQRGIAATLAPAGSHDACFVPRQLHLTGDIRVHEIGWAGSELWIANTRFSCLASLDPWHSFVPRWQPKFITRLEPTDRCHLNGLAVVDGRVKYVTCLAATDEGGAWREHKADGGLIIDVGSDEFAATGLSMPHSPRWHQGALWVLESGRGTLSRVDLARGRAEPVVELPGFTRGLAFHGPFAFIGLSQIREGIFGGLPLLERLEERLCGIWVVDLRSARIVGFLRFEGQVQEIFDVQVLPNCRYPELLEPEDERIQGAFVLPVGHN